MRQGNGTDILGTDDARGASIGMLYLSPADDRESVKEALNTQERFGKKQVAIVLPDQNKAFQRPEDFEDLNGLSRKLKTEIIFIAPAGGPADFAHQRGFTVYPTIDDYTNYLKDEEKNGGKILGSFSGGKPHKESAKPPPPADVSPNSETGNNNDPVSTYTIRIELPPVQPPAVGSPRPATPGPIPLPDLPGTGDDADPDASPPRSPALGTVIVVAGFAILFSIVLFSIVLFIVDIFHPSIPHAPVFLTPAFHAFFVHGLALFCCAILLAVCSCMFLRTYLLARRIHPATGSWMFIGACIGTLTDVTVAVIDVLRQPLLHPALPAWTHVVILIAGGGWIIFMGRAWYTFRRMYPPAAPHVPPAAQSTPVAGAGSGGAVATTTPYIPPLPYSFLPGWFNLFGAIFLTIVASFSLQLPGTMQQTITQQCALSPATMPICTLWYTPGALLQLGFYPPGWVFVLFAAGFAWLVDSLLVARCNARLRRKYPAQKGFVTGMIAIVMRCIKIAVYIGILFWSLHFTQYVPSWLWLISGGGILFIFALIFNTLYISAQKEQRLLAFFLEIPSGVVLGIYTRYILLELGWTHILLELGWTHITPSSIITAIVIVVSLAMLARQIGWKKDWRFWILSNIPDEGALIMAICCIALAISVISL